MYKVLIVEDDPMVAMINEQYIKRNKNFEIVGKCSDGLRALDFLEKNTVDLLILDVFMPKMDGFETLRQIRNKQITVEAIMVTAANDRDSLEEALHLGIVDYLVKPFDILELLVRMEKVLARSAPAENKITYQDITMDLDSRSVHKAGELISLKPMEYELLCTFMKHPGMVLTREKLLRQVWGDEYIGETRTVDVHVAALRKKLGLTEQLATVFKLGYRLEGEMK